MTTTNIEPDNATYVYEYDLWFADGYLHPIRMEANLEFDPPYIGYRFSRELIDTSLLVPEPSPHLAMATALLSLAALRRRLH